MTTLLSQSCAKPGFFFKKIPGVVGNMGFTRVLGFFLGQPLNLLDSTLQGIYIIYWSCGGFKLFSLGWDTPNPSKKKNRKIPLICFVASDTLFFFKLPLGAKS